MDAPKPTLAAEIGALREAYAALNRNDIPGFVAIFDPQVERVEPSDAPLGGVYRGLEAVTAHVAEGRGSWAEGSCQPERFVVVGDQIIVVAQVRVRLKHEAEWRVGRIGDVFTFRHGKAIGFRTFWNEAEAFAWAGANASEAG